MKQQLTKVTSIIQTNFHILLELKIITAPDLPGKLGPKNSILITTNSKKFQTIFIVKKVHSFHKVIQ